MHGNSNGGNNVSNEFNIIVNASGSISSGGGGEEEILLEQQQDNNPNHDYDYRVQMYQLVVPAFLVLSLLAVLANCLVILALRASRVRNAMVTLLLSLTFSDIWSSSVMALSLLLNSYLPTVFHTRPRPCFALCLEMFRTGGLLTAALHLLLIALHHCVGIVRPHLDKHTLRRWAFVLCLLAWTLPPSTLLLLASARPEQGLWNCERVDFYYERHFRWAVSGLLLGLFLAITVCYARLLCILHTQNAKLASSTGNTGATLPGERKRRRERRTLGTTLLICLSYLLGWAPASILFALTCSDCHFLTGSFRLLFGLSCVQLSFLLAKSLLNPLIYSLRIPEVRQQFEQKLAQCRSHLLAWTGGIIGGKKGSGGAGTSTSGDFGGGRKKSSNNNNRRRPCRSHLFASSISSMAREDFVAAAQHANQQQSRQDSLLLLVPDRTNCNGHQMSQKENAEEQQGIRRTSQRYSLNSCSFPSIPTGANGWLLQEQQQQDEQAASSSSPRSLRRWTTGTSHREAVVRNPRIDR